MIVARLRDISAPHAGMVVQIDDTAIAADFVLVLIASEKRSGGNQFIKGYRVITKNVIDCDIWQSGEDTPATRDCVSLCTMDNLLYYKLAPPRPGGIQYALALVSNVGNGNFMIDYVESIGLENVEEYTTPAKRHSWSPTRTPFAAKKVRKLAQSPTDASLPHREASRAM